jgi:transketolase
MAMASRWLAERYNRANLTLFDYDVFAICSDGDLMEGVASEAASLAGHLRLSNLCWIYDSNTVTIEGHTELAFSEDVESRFKGYHWNVLRVRDANDRTGIAEALQGFRRTTDRPTLIIVDSIIGYGAPHKQNTAAAHSDALGEDEVRLAKRFYGWPEDARFLVPDGVYQRFREGIGARGRALREAWQSTFERYRHELPDAAMEITWQLSRQLPSDWDADLPEFAADDKGIATRDASGKVLNAIAARVPWLLGGAADLAPSTKTKLSSDGARTLSAGS